MRSVLAGGTAALGAGCRQALWVSQADVQVPFAALTGLLAPLGDQGERHALSHVRHTCAATLPGMRAAGSWA